MVKKMKDMATLIPFLAIVALFELVPLFTIIFGSFKADDGSGITIDNYVRVFTKPAYQTAIVNSLIITMFSVVIGIIIAVLASAAVRNCGRKVQNVFSSILNITSNFAGVPLAFAYMIMLGNSGVLVLIGEKFGISALANFDLYSTSGLAFMYVYFQIPLGTLLMLPAFDAIKKQWKEAAVLMKAGPAKFWMHIGIPVLMPSILGTISVLFSNALAAYATAYALLSSNYSLLPISITNMFVGDVVMRKGLGSALSVVMMLLMTAAVLINQYFLKRSRRVVQ